MRKVHLLHVLILISFVLLLSNCAVVPTCPNQLMPIIEVQVNNTASTHDDYIGTASFTPCRARITNARSFNNALNFAGGVEVELRNIPLATTLTLSSSSSGGSSSYFATLPADGGWLDFFVKGNTTSTVDKSAIIELATAGASCNEVVLTRKALMVPSGAPPISPTATLPRVEIEVAGISTLDDYLTWSPTSTRIKWTNPTTPTATLNVTIRNITGSNRLRFTSTYPGAGATATGTTANVTLVGDSAIFFYMAGNFGNASVEDKDAIFEVVDASTGNLLAREGVMVRIRKNVNALTTTERDRYLEALRNVHEVYNFYMLFRNSHSRNGGAFANIGHRQAHIGSAFLPWHRAFMLHFERLIESADPSVALPYWHFDQSSPNMFNSNFIGSNDPGGGNVAILSATNPIRTWAIPGETAGIRRRTPYGDAGIPASVPNTGTGVANETSTLALGTVYSSFKNMEGTTHNGAHNNSGNSGISWVGSSPADAPMDPLFYFLHCNIDRLWAKWQWVNTRYDGTQVDTYDLQGGHFSSPSQPPVYTENLNGRITSNRTYGQYANDSMWPWDNVTGTTAGTGTGARPTVVPLTPFPIVIGGFIPFSKPNVGTMMDFRAMNFAYDDFTPY